ncbi:MAG: hypothetical protein GF308_05800 [Candidatus Heimdallarchaeota archaeon]|nr:hypothetical protein [Candidatus Heimdallarchaeota archaeon]
MMILAIGNINIDLICSVPRLPKPDDKVIVSNYTRVPGGGACNFAVGLARLGSTVSLFGHVGKDQEGRRAIDSLISENVDVSKVIHELEIPTGFVIILVDEQGESVKIGCREANACLSPTEITNELFEGIELVHVSSVSVPIALQVAKKAKELSIISSIDFGGELMGTKKEILTKIINQYSIVFLNSLSFRQAFGMPPTPPNFQKINLEKDQILNVTLGNQGSYIITPKKNYFIPSWKVDVVDTTGAGDAYAAGFIHYYSTGIKDLEEIGHKAATCAAIQITRSSARKGMPTKFEVEKFIEKGY